MFVTSREQKLIQHFLKKGKLTISEMIELTGTSRRTLYRDLEKLQESLPLEITLENSADGYFLRGDLQQLEEARELVEYSVIERLNGELLFLIENKASIISITEYFGISQPTATNDLRQIEQVLLESELILERERGLKIKGREENIRSVLVSSIYNSCSIQELLTANFSENKVLEILDLEKFNIAHVAFEDSDLPEGLTDKVRVLMQLFLTAALLRLDRKQTVVADAGMKGYQPSKKALNFVNHLLTKVPIKGFTIGEIVYLASIYDILYFGFGRDILFMEKFDTDFSYKIRQLIDQVSTILEIKFGKDDRLYGLLYAHLKESDILPTLFSEKQNDFIKKIEIDNQKIYKAVKVALTEVFKKRFSEIEFAYVTLHFVATLERSDLVRPLRAALVTSEGLISCEFLMSDLRKNFPFLKKIELIQSSMKFEKSKYDVIFTTEKELDYLYVSRMMDQKNLDGLRQKLREIQQNKKVLRLDEDEVQKDFIDLNALFIVGNALVKGFEIKKITNKAVLSDVVTQIIHDVNPDDSGELVNLIKTRFQETHLAIPETEIALFHGVHSYIKTPIFKIYDLSEELEVIGMNRKLLKIKRSLLLLAPPKVPDYVAYLLGKISSSIIENKLYTTIYNSGNEEVIRELLRQIITEAIKTYGD